ncbi:MAG: hypothetical protein HYU36_24395 [Planctomycetes bacterium]|nr:hypothetical protein [Planctomycetota bacterium]
MNGPDGVRVPFPSRLRSPVFFALALGLGFLLSPEAPAEGPQWSAQERELLLDGQPRLLVAIADAEPTPGRLRSYREAGLDAVWVRPLLNDTPEGVEQVFHDAVQAGIPLIGGLPIPNLKEFQPQRIRSHAGRECVAAWTLCTPEEDILAQALEADSRRLFVVPGSPEKALPTRCAHVASEGWRPCRGGPLPGPAVLSVSISETSDTVALGMLAEVIFGARGLLLHAQEDGLPAGEQRLRWLAARLPTLRSLHQALLPRPLEWRPVKTEVARLAMFQASTDAGDWFWAGCPEKPGQPCEFRLPTSDPENLVVLHASGGVRHEAGKGIAGDKGELLLGPRRWRQAMTAASAVESLPPSKADASGDPRQAGIRAVQKRLEHHFEFCTLALASLERPQLESVLPALLPYFRRYYGERMTPLLQMKTAKGEEIDLGDLVIGGAVEKVDFHPSGKEAGTEVSRLAADVPDAALQKRIQAALSSERGAAGSSTVLEDLQTLEEEFLAACLQWEASADAKGRLNLFPIPGSNLAGGLYLLNLAADPVELFLSDSEYQQSLWASAPIPPDSPGSDSFRSAGLQKAGQTLAANFTEGYTVVVPAGARREILVDASCARAGRFSYVPLNRKSGWGAAEWALQDAKASSPLPPGRGTRFLVPPAKARPVVVWSGNLWDPVDALAGPPEGARPPEILQTHLYRGEWETLGLHLYNPSDRPACVLIRVESPLPCSLLAFAYTRAQEWTADHLKDVLLDSRQDPPDRPLPDGPTNGFLVYLNTMGEVWIPPDETRQVLLVLRSGQDSAPGVHSGRIEIFDPSEGKAIASIALGVRVWPLALPAPAVFSGTGYVIGSSIYRPRNFRDALDHHFNAMGVIAQTPSLELDWKKEEIRVGDVQESAKDLEADKALADAGFLLLLGGWGSTGMRLKGGIIGFIDESVRQVQASAAGEEAKDALHQMGGALASGQEDRRGGVTEETEEGLDEEEERPRSPAEEWREKAERLKKKYWPGGPGYENLVHQIYVKTIRFYLDHGFKPESLAAYVWDEPPPEIFDAVVRMGRLMKQSYPGVRTHITSNYNMSGLEARDAVDIFTPHMGHIYNPWMAVDSLGHALAGPDTHLGRYRSQAHELWFYMQHCDYLQGEHAVDYPMGLLWRAWQINVKGVGLYSLRNIRGDLGFFPTKKYEAWREGVEDLLALRSLEAEIFAARSQGKNDPAVQRAEEALRVHSQEVLGLQWWWADPARRYRLIRAARQAVAEAHLAIAHAGEPGP